MFWRAERRLGAPGPKRPGFFDWENGNMLEFDHVGSLRASRSRARIGSRSVVRATIRKSTRIYRVSALPEPDRTVPEAIKAIPPCCPRDAEIVIAPFIVGDFLEVVFVPKHINVREDMRYLKEGWFGK
jgi:hypothetical protein